MSIREDILKSIKDEENKLLVVKIIDYIEQVKKYYEPRFTQFLDPSQVVKAKRVISQFDEVDFFCSCVVGDCERNIICIHPDYMNSSDIRLPVAALAINGNFKFETIGHRDILGALMSLGIKREKIGDIILNDNKYFMITYDDVSDYIIMNLNKIKHTSVNISRIDFEDIPKKEIKFKEVMSTVASLRLDSVASLGFGESRNSIAKEISKGNIRVNWEETTDLSYIVHEGDVISLKGRGRIILHSVEGHTKKNRISIIIRRII